MIGNITLGQAASALLALAAAIVGISKAVDVIAGLFKPGKAQKKRLDEHDKLLANDFARLNALEAESKENKRFQGVICRTMLAQLNHELSGNDISHLRDARDEMNDFLTKR